MPQSALERFRAACGLTVPLALECQDADGSGFEVHQLGPPFALIGRDPRSDIVLHGSEVSRLHAYVQSIAGGVYCIDLNSRTQLRWDDRDEPAVCGWLEPGSLLRIGRHTFRTEQTDALPERSVPLDDPFAPCSDSGVDGVPLPAAGLESPIRMTQQDSLCRVEGRLALIGRSDSCQIVLRDASVSRFHAALLRTASGVWIADLLSREGLRINGLRVRWGWLEDGDTVRIGQFTFVLRYDVVPDLIRRADVPLEAGVYVEPDDSADGSDSRPRRARHGTELAVRPARKPPAPSRLPAGAPRALTPDVLEAGSVERWQAEAELPPGQLAMWQQQMQMMETFHKEMILMVQMFMAMHREHRQTIQDELQKVQKLTRKLGALQADLAGTAQESSNHQAASREGPAASAPAKGPAPRSATAPARPARTGERARGPFPVPAPAPEPEAASVRPAGSRPVPPAEGQDREAAGSAALGAVDLHSQLTQRIMKLQRERQGYWKRILNAING